MTLRFAHTAVAFAAALSLAAMPAAAQNPRAEGRERARPRTSQAASGERETRGSRAVPRPAETPKRSAAQAPQDQAPRNTEGRRNQASQAGPRSNSGDQSPASHADDRRGYQQNAGAYGRSHTRGYVRPPHFQPYRPLSFSRPYYGFRPHVHIGFGVWLGVSVPFPWAYFGPYVPRVYGYYDPGYYGVAVGVRQYGGLSFDMQPADADLYVDGEYVGYVGTFTPYGEPLTLWPGVHRIAIVRDGFRTMEWEVTVQPGQVIPYRGTLARW